MILPPIVIDVHVRERNARTHRIWFPFFILWPLLLVIVILALVITVLVDVAMFLAGARTYNLTRLLIGSLHLLADTRGTSAYVNSPTTLVDVKIY
jgi:hypothetical protein